MYQSFKFGNVSFLLALALAGIGCSESDMTVEQTFFGWADDQVYTMTGTSPLIYYCDNQSIVGGSGSYENPVTATVNAPVLNACEIVWYPYLEKYLIQNFACSGCADDQIGVFIGSGSGGQGELDCETQLTPNGSQTIIRNPGTDYQANTNSLWTQSGGCMPQNVPGLQQ